MARSVATIGVSVTARTSKFRKGMKRAQTQLRAFGASVGRIMRRVARFSAVLATGAVAALALFVRSQLKALDSLAKTSKKLGLTTEELAGFHHAAKLAGLSTKTFDMSLQRMTRRMSEAAWDTGEAQAALKELGLDAKKLRLGGPTKAMYAIAEALSRVTNQSDRVRLGFKLLDSEGVAVILMLQNGRAALERAADEARRFGTAISGVQATQIEQANDAITRLKESLRGLGVQLTVRLSSAIEGLATLFTDWGTAARDASSVVVDAVARMAGAMGAVLDVMWKVKVGFKTIALVAVESFRSLQILIGQFVAQLASPSGPIGMLERALGELMPESVRGVIATMRTAGQIPRHMTVGTDLADSMRRSLKAMLEEGPPSKALQEIFDNLARASRQTAEAAAKAPRMAAVVVPTRAAPTRFAEIDLSRTFIGGLSGGRGRKQQVTDVDVVKELQGLRQDQRGRQPAALMGP